MFPGRVLKAWSRARALAKGISKDIVTGLLSRQQSQLTTEHSESLLNREPPYGSPPLVFYFHIQWY